MQILFFRFFFRGIYLTKRVEPILEWAGIQDTNGPSSDRLIQEGRRHVRRLSSIFRFQDRPPRHLDGAPALDLPFCPGFLHESGYWLKKHRIDKLVDSQGSFDYFVCLSGLEIP